MLLWEDHGHHHGGAAHQRGLGETTQVAGERDEVKTGESRGRAREEAEESGRELNRFSV